jgi:hypothetical protein
MITSAPWQPGSLALAQGQGPAAPASSLHPGRRLHWQGNPAGMSWLQALRPQVRQQGLGPIMTVTSHGDQPVQWQGRRVATAARRRAGQAAGNFKLKVIMRVVKHSWFLYMSLVCWFHCERSLSVWPASPGLRPTGMTVTKLRYHNESCQAQLVPIHESPSRVLVPL